MLPTVTYSTAKLLLAKAIVSTAQTSAAGRAPNHIRAHQQSMDFARETVLVDVLLWPQAGLDI